MDATNVLLSETAVLKCSDKCSRRKLDHAQLRAHLSPSAAVGRAWTQAVLKCLC